MITSFAFKYPLYYCLLLAQWIQMLKYWSNNYLKHFDDIPPVECLDHIQVHLFFFAFPNRRWKVRMFWSRLTFNISLKQPLLKLRFSCTDIFLNLLNIKIKQMLRYFRLSLKQVFWGVFLISSFWTIIFWRIITNCTYKLSSNAIFNIRLDISWIFLWLAWRFLQ